MFESDLEFAMKAIQLTSQTKHSNPQKLLNSELFMKCWQKYHSFLPRAYYAQKLIESGEELLSFSHFYNLADTYCFAHYLTEFDKEIQQAKLSKQEGQLFFLQLFYRAQAGRALVVYLRALRMDPCIASPKGVSLVENTLNELVDIKQGCSQQEQLEFSGILLAQSFHIRHICEQLGKNHHYELVSNKKHVKIYHLQKL
jgi:hypothetical protein